MRSGADEQTFVLKVWVESGGVRDVPSAWRGHVTHVPTGERADLESLEDLTTFVARHLRRMGVELAPESRAALQDERSG